MKRVSIVCRFAILSFILASCSSFQNVRVDSAEVPNIESWKEIIYSEDSNNDKKDRGQIFIRWFQNPRDNGYDGMVLYYKPSKDADPIPIIKSWNFRKDDKGDYDWSETRVALWLEDRGAWFTGDKGERLRTSRQYKDGKTISVTYTFEGRNSLVSKTVQLKEKINTP